MNSMIRYLFLCFFMVSAAACSSGDGDSNSNSNQALEARINSGNAEQLGTAATEAVKQAVLKNSTSMLGFKSSTKPGMGTVSIELSKSFARRVASIPVPGLNCGPGSADQITNPDASTTITFINCDFFGLGIVFNGTVLAFTSTSGNTTTVDLEYINFTIDDGVDIVTLDMQASCTTDNTTLDTSCTLSNIVGFDGRIYTFSSATVLGDETSGYTVTAIIVDPDHGSFSIDTNVPILFGCANGQPISGEIQFTDGAGVLVTVTLNDCASYTVSYSGTSEMYLW